MKGYTIILRTTSKCNLSCKYCYDKQNNKDKLIPDKEFKNNIDNIIKYLSTINEKDGDYQLILHGGEPMLIRPDTYSEFIDKINNENVKYKIGMQSNGTLINEEYIRFLKKYNIQLGISLDGCNEEENSCRIYPNGKNSLNTVLNNVQKLIENKNRFGIIMTITNKHIGHEKEIYEFIEKNNIKCNIRPAYIVGKNKEHILTPEEYYNFFINLFEIWYNDKRGLVKLNQIQEIYLEYMYALDEKFLYKSCTNGLQCFNNFISLDIYGNIYSCNRLYNNSEFFYGNLNNKSWKEITQKMAMYTNKRRNSITNNEKCKNCKIFYRCKGGCPACAYNLHKQYIKPYDYYCETNIKIYDYIKDKLTNNGDIEKYKRIK